MTTPNDCIICGKWPEPDRWALREMIDALPLTGSGKTTVMAMLIAWQAVNAARKDSKDFSRPS